MKTISIKYAPPFFREKARHKFACTFLLQGLGVAILANISVTDDRQLPTANRQPPTANCRAAHMGCPYGQPPWAASMGCLYGLPVWVVSIMGCHYGLPPCVMAHLSFWWQPSGHRGHRGCTVALIISQNSNAPRTDDFFYRSLPLAKYCCTQSDVMNASF